MADRLTLYKRALQIAGERTITSLTENVEGRHLLDNVWTTGGVDLCLSEGTWSFAIRSAQVDYDTAVSPPFGYAHAFTKPDDYIRIVALCTDEFFRVPHLRYIDEGGYWWADEETIYVRYVSNDAAYGGNIGGWPPLFFEFVASHFATQIILKLSDSDERWSKFVNAADPHNTVRGRALLLAKAQVQQERGTQFIAPGTWTRSRMRGVNRRDGGSSSNLIG